jgi:hypothetical protein
MTCTQHFDSHTTCEVLDISNIITQATERLSPQGERAKPDACDLLELLHNMKVALIYRSQQLRGENPPGPGPGGVRWDLRLDRGLGRCFLGEAPLSVACNVMYLVYFWFVSCRGNIKAVCL